MKKSACFCLGIALLLAACAINPVTGKRELSLISEQQEIELGKETDAEIGQEYGYYSDPELNRYVDSVGQSMIPYTHRPKLIYHFAVLDTPVVNAFAAPGGYVYVTRGILALMGSESELAAVLGHEIGHVNARHTVRQMSTQILVQAGLAVGSALNETFAKVAGVAGLGAQLLFLKFSRDDERQADGLGLQYARAVHYNTGEMITFFSALERYGDLSGGSSLPGFLSTHPLTSERIQNVKSMLTEDDVAPPVKREPYLARIDGLVFGDDPRQGFVENGTFYHPGMRFRFSVPAGWKVQNAPARVTMASDKGDAAVIFQTEKTDESLPAYAQKKAGAIEGRKPVSEQPGTISGMAALHQTYDIVKEGQDTLRARFSFIRRGDQIFTFTSLSKAVDFNRFDATFQSAVSSFSGLRDPSYLNRRPQTIQVLKADGRLSLKDYFAKNNAKKETWSYLTIMNGMKDADAVPEPSRLLKLVR